MAINMGFIYFPLSYTLVIFIGFFLVNFLSNGFLKTFIAVKMSRGKKVLVEVHSLADVYYKAGRFDGNLLMYKDRSGNKRSVQVEKKNVIYKIGLKGVITEEETNTVLTPDFTGATGYDAVKVDKLIERAIMMPKNSDDRLIKLIFFFSLITVLVALYIAFKTYSIQELMTAAEAARVIA